MIAGRVAMAIALVTLNNSLLKSERIADSPYSVSDWRFSLFN